MGFKNLRVLLPIACAILATIVLTLPTQLRHFTQPYGKFAPAQIALFTRTYCAEHIHRHAHLVAILRAFDRPVLVLDVGANVGVVTLPILACITPSHRVISVEPVKANLKAMLQTASQFGLRPDAVRWQLSKTAFSDKSGATTIYIPGVRGDNAALSRNASKTNMGPRRRTTIEERITTQTGDGFLRRQKLAPLVVKIDVQGSEIKVLMGMYDFLRGNRDLLVIAEQHNDLMRDSGYHPLTVYTYMKALGFKVFCNPSVKVVQGRMVISDKEHPPDDVHLCGDLTYWKRKV